MHMEFLIVIFKKPTTARYPSGEIFGITLIAPKVMNINANVPDNTPVKIRYARLILDDYK